MHVYPLCTGTDDVPSIVSNEPAADGRATTGIKCKQDQRACVICVSC